MITIIFVLVFGGLLVGFMIYKSAFGGLKRKGQSGEAEVNAMRNPPKVGRADSKED